MAIRGVWLSIFEPISKIQCVVCVTIDKYHKLPTFCIIIGFLVHQNIRVNHKFKFKIILLFLADESLFSERYWIFFKMNYKIMNTWFVTHEHWKVGWLVVEWICLLCYFENHLSKLCVSWMKCACVC